MKVFLNIWNLIGYQCFHTAYLSFFTQDMIINKTMLIDLVKVNSIPVQSRTKMLAVFDEDET